MEHDTRRYLPAAVLAFSSALSVATALLIIVAFWLRTARLSRGEIRRQVTQLEKRLALVHYLLCIPLFELFVIWGPVVYATGIKQNSPSIVLSWASINLAALVALLAAFFSRKNYRMMVHVAQLLQFPAMSFVFADRLYNGSMGPEGMVISALIVCGIVEIFTVPDFFRPDTRLHQDYEMRNSIHYATDPDALYKDTTQRYDNGGVVAMDGDEGSTSDVASRDDQHQFSGRNVTERRTREKLASDVFTRLYEIDAAKANRKELRALIEWCQQQIAIIFDSPDGLPDRSSASETLGANGAPAASDERMPWDRSFVGQSKRLSESRTGQRKTRHVSSNFEGDEF